jgi:hypothetical protein
MRKTRAFGISEKPDDPMTRSPDDPISLPSEARESLVSSNMVGFIL